MLLIMMLHIVKLPTEMLLPMRFRWTVGARRQAVIVNAATLEIGLGALNAATLEISLGITGQGKVTTGSTVKTVIVTRIHPEVHQRYRTDTLLNTLTIGVDTTADTIAETRESRKGDSGATAVIHTTTGKVTTVETARSIWGKDVGKTAKLTKKVRPFLESPSLLHPLL